MSHANKRVKERIDNAVNKKQAIALHGSSVSAGLAKLNEVIDVDAQTTVSSVTGVSPSRTHIGSIFGPTLVSFLFFFHTMTMH